jgi:hypothetical protein
VRSCIGGIPAWSLVRHSRRGQQFRIRPLAKEHTTGDLDCRACGTVSGIHYPRPHREGPSIVHLEFLVNGEALDGVFVQQCEGGCEMPSVT